MTKKSSKGFQWDCLYQCCACGNEFVIKGNDKFDHEPATRKSPCCKTNPVQFKRTIKGLRAQYISDDLGTKGIFNHADGKTYDSKSSYYKAVKAKGLEIVGNEPIKQSQPKTSHIDWERAVHESIQQLK